MIPVPPSTRILPCRIVSTTERETRDAGERLAPLLRAGDVILLEGALGAGKTVFARGVASALGVDPAEIRSPTFTLVNIYRGARFPVYHVDLYRIDREADLVEIGLEEILGTDGVALVEWGDRLGRYAVGGAVTVRIEDRGEDHREISIEAEAT